MRATKIVSLLIVVFSLCSNPAWSKDDKPTADKVKDGAGAVANEIGKGLQAVGQAVGPAVEKAEKSVRGTDGSNKDKKQK